MAVIIHREIKDELVIPLAKLIGAVSYGEFKDVEVTEEIEEEVVRPIEGDTKGKTETIKVKKSVTKTVKEKVVPPSFEEHLSALSHYLAMHFDMNLNNYLDQLAQEDPEIKAKKAELEALISAKKG